MISALTKWKVCEVKGCKNSFILSTVPACGRKGCEKGFTQGNVPVRRE
jgi:hypothetical protein